MAERRPLIPLAKPDLGEPEVRAARRAILSGWVTQGPEVLAFEKEFAEYVGAPHACAVSSGTAALHLALLAVGVRAGDEVITASHSFIASANAVRYCGATPVFVDIEPTSFNIDPAQLERVVSKRTRAILCVHQLGMPCDLGEIAKAARAHGVKLVEDAACALGSQILTGNAWERLGRPHGDVACFSFHPRKTVTTGDGGMLTTASADLDRQFRLMRQHGMSASDVARHTASSVVFESYPALGYNYRLTDIQAAVGREQLHRLPDLLERRHALAARYRERLSSVRGLRTPAEPSWARSNWQSYCVWLPGGCDQRAVMQRLLDQGIATRRGVMCAHREPAYPRREWSCGVPAGGCECVDHTCARLAVSEQAQDRCLLLPLYAQMTEREQDQVVAALGEACAA